MNYRFRAFFQNWEIMFLLILGIFFFTGFLGHLIPLFKPLMLLLTPYLLLICGLITFSVTLTEQGPVLILWAVPTFLITFALEAVGVATGQIFGAYRYDSILGTQFWGVPPIIGFNWVLVVLGIARFVKKELHVSHAALGAFIAALLCVGFDFILEPLAISLGYWTWDTGTVPFKNYAAWFLISYISALPTWYFRQQTRSIVLEGYIIIQAVFFILVRIGLAFIG